jgi:hypothetical protein
MLTPFQELDEDYQVESVSGDVDKRKFKYERGRQKLRRLQSN